MENNVQNSQDIKQLDTKDVLEYSWKWFEYHAGQRLSAFRFFMVFLGAIAVALGQALKEGQFHMIALIAGPLGILISVAFLMLEFRNEALVQIGREALKSLEGKVFATFPDKTKLFLADEKNKRPAHSYKLWVRIIYGTSILIFIGVIVGSQCLR
jgi:hypothetical protein